MADHTYGITEVVGTSSESLEAAVANAIRDVAADQTDLDWFEVKEIRGRVEGDKVGWYQVLVRIGARYD